MFFTALDVSRNIAVILLALESILLCAIPLFVLLKVTQGLRRLLPQVVPFLHRAHDWLRGLRRGVESVTAAVRVPFETVQRWNIRVRTLLRRAQTTLYDER